VTHNCIEKPIRQPQFDRHHPAISRILFDDLPRVYYAKALALANAVRAYVRRNPRSREPFEGFLKLIIIATPCMAIGTDEQIVSGDAHRGTYILAVRIYRSHKLAHRINQYVLSKHLLPQRNTVYEAR
jgi:hypothetical protein